MSIKDYLITEKELSQSDKAPQQKAKPTWTVEEQSGADVIICRTVGKSKQHLCLIFSQSMFYIKKASRMEHLEYKNFTSFFSGSDMLVLGTNFVLSNEKNVRENFIKFLNILPDGDEDTMKKARNALLASGIMVVQANDLHDYTRAWRRESTLLNAAILFAANFKCLLKDMQGKGEVNNWQLEAIIDIANEFGIDNTRKALEPIMAKAQLRGHTLELHSLFDLNTNGKVNYGYSGIKYYGDSKHSSTMHVHFEFDRFLDYMFRQSVAEGFENDLSEWVRTWKDALSMEILINKRIVDKYPENLLSYHQILAAEALKIQEKINEEMFSKRVEESRFLEYSHGDYIIKVPESKNDFLDEACQQHNCLAGYVSTFINGACLIAFLRKKDNPDKSFVTLEVRTKSNGDLLIMQAKEKYNHNPSRDIMDYLNEWIDKLNKERMLLEIPV